MKITFKQKTRRAVFATSYIYQKKKKNKEL